MNYKKIILPILLSFITSLLVAQPVGPKPQGPKKHYGLEKGKHKGEFYEERIDKLAEKGIITEQEKQEAKDAINDLKKYRQEVWSDGKLTKEEQQSLIEKEKTVREKIRSILDKAKERVEEKHKDPKEREQMFNKRIDDLLKDKKITQQQAEELKKKHKELLDLEEKIWSDGVMTKEEREELAKKRQELDRQLRDVYKQRTKRKPPVGEPSGQP
jgi:acetyl-CoA carboxylase carboxyltransferase component